MRMTMDQIREREARMIASAETSNRGSTLVEVFAKEDEKAEREIQDEICQYLNLKEIIYAHQPMRKRSQLVEGFPDFALAHKGVPVALEVKTATGRLSAEQEAVKAKMEANGWLYVTIRHGVGQVKAVLDSIERKV